MGTDGRTSGWLYAAWRVAKASWDLASYTPALTGEDASDELESKHCNATADALNAYLLHPAADMADLAMKMRVFRDEDIIDSWIKGPEIVAVLAEDARRLAFPGST